MISETNKRIKGKNSHRESGAERNIRVRSSFKYHLVLEGVVIGAAVGLIISVFRLLLTDADALRTRLVYMVNSGARGTVIGLLVFAVIAVLIDLLLKAEPEISGSGIPQVEGELKGQVEQNWWKVLVCKFAGCVLAIGGGLALGREGPSIQLGAMAGKGFARLRHRELTEERMLMTSGAGAGLAAAFGAPLAGALFSLEELHKNFSGEILISTLAATVTADFVAVNIVGLTPVFNFNVTHRIPLRLYWSVILLGVILGLFGAFYNGTLDFMQDLFAKIPTKLLRISAMLAISFCLMYVYPIALGSGNPLVTQISAGEFTMGALALLLVVKFLFSTASFGSGAPGGIFLPLLVLGALTGGLYCRLLGLTAGINQEYMTAYVLIAMTGYFAAIVRAPVTGIILLTEMTGNFYSLLAMSVTSLTAFVVADLAGAQPVYDQLLKKRLGKARTVDHMTSRGELESRGEAGRKVIIDSEVYLGSFMDGRKLADIGLPKGSLVVAIIRGDDEIIPGGSTVLKAGDTLQILCRNEDIAETETRLEARCRTVL